MRAAFSTGRSLGSRLPARFNFAGKGSAKNGEGLGGIIT